MRSSVLAAAILLVLAATLFIVSAPASGGGALTVEWYVLLVGFLLGAALFAVRDPYGFSTFIAGLSLFGAFILWLMSMTGTTSTTSTVVLGLLCAIGLGGGVGFVAWTNWSRDPIPDLLRQAFSPRSIFETNGVQYSFAGPALLTLDTIAPLELVLQNCTSEARAVDLEIAEASLLPAKRAILSRSPQTVQLGSSEVKRVRIPICVSADARAASVRLYPRLRVSGPRGRRTRRWRAAPALKPASLLQIIVVTLLLFPVGIQLVVLDRGGLVISIDRRGRLRGREEMPEPDETLLWAPSMDHGTRVALDS